MRADFWVATVRARPRHHIQLSPDGLRQDSVSFAGREDIPATARIMTLGRDQCVLADVGWHFDVVARDQSHEQRGRIPF
jgi:hypothetical protein